MTEFDMTILEEMAKQREILKAMLARCDNVENLFLTGGFRSDPSIHAIRRINVIPLS